MRDKLYYQRMAEMFALALADALSIKVTKDDVKDYLEKKLKEFEQKEQYEKCAEILEDIKKLEKMV
jgi:excinuclease UvrABC nuclease subunit